MQERKKETQKLSPLYKMAENIPIVSSLLKTFQKHAYSRVLKISPSKTEYFQIKNSKIFHISAQNIDCGY